MDAIKAIEERNRRVEAEKAWELSLTRRLCIVIVIYATACVFLAILHVPQYFLHALVPVGGYVFSTLSFPWVKNIWLKSWEKLRLPPDA